MKTKQSRKEAVELVVRLNHALYAYSGEVGGKAPQFKRHEHGLYSINWEGQKFVFRIEEVEPEKPPEPVAKTKK